MGWIEVRWLWRPFEYSQDFVTWIVHCSRKGMQMVCINANGWLWQLRCDATSRTAHTQQDGCSSFMLLKPNSGPVIHLRSNNLSLDGFSLLCKPENELRVSITMKQQFLNYSDQPVWHQEACKTQSCLNPSVFSPHYSAALLENLVFKLPCPSLCPLWIEMLGMLLKKILKLISS